MTWSKKASQTNLSTFLSLPGGWEVPIRGSQTSQKMSPLSPVSLSSTGRRPPDQLIPLIQRSIRTGLNHSWMAFPHKGNPAAHGSNHIQTLRIYKVNSGMNEQLRDRVHVDNCCCFSSCKSLKYLWSPPGGDAFTPRCEVNQFSESAGKLKMSLLTCTDRLLQMWDNNVSQQQGQVGGLRKCGSLCADWAPCLLRVFHSSWGMGAEEATLTQRFPSRWAIGPSSLFTETIRHHLLFNHDKENWQSRLQLVLRWNWH